jgi:hypothetical protein
MKESIFLSFIFLITSIAFESCRPANKSTSAFQNFSVELIREEPGGVILLKSFGSGYNQPDCIENAMYNAIREVIFKGVKGSTDSRPLLMGANPEEKYRDYFSAFFAKNGTYKNFASLSNRGNIDKGDRFEVASGKGRREIDSRRAERITIGVEVAVKKTDLQNEINKLIK